MNNKHSLPSGKVVMRLYIISIVAFIAAVSSTVTAAVTHNDVDNALKMLDRELAHRDTYTNRREGGIDSLKQKRHSSPIQSNEWFDATMRIARGYSSFNNDSALAYYTQRSRKTWIRLDCHRIQAAACTLSLHLRIRESRHRRT